MINKKLLWIIIGGVLAYQLGDYLWKKTPLGKKIEKENEELDQEIDEQMNKFVNDFKADMERKWDEQSNN